MLIWSSHLCTCGYEHRYQIVSLQLSMISFFCLALVFTSINFLWIRTKSKQMENRAEEASEWKPRKGYKSSGLIHQVILQPNFSVLSHASHSKIFLHVQDACLRECLFVEVWRPWLVAIASEVWNDVSSKPKQEFKINFPLYQSQPCCDLEAYMLRWSSCENFICTVQLFQSIFVERWDGNAFISLVSRLISVRIWRLN